MYKVFVNQDEIILTSKVPFGDKISIYDLKEIPILEIVKLVKKQKKIFLIFYSLKRGKLLMQLDTIIVTRILLKESSKIYLRASCKIGKEINKSFVN